MAAFTTSPQMSSGCYHGDLALRTTEQEIGEWDVEHRENRSLCSGPRPRRGQEVLWRYAGTAAVGRGQVRHHIRRQRNYFAPYAGARLDAAAIHHAGLGS